MVNGRGKEYTTTTVLPIIVTVINLKISSYCVKSTALIFNGQVFMGENIEFNCDLSYNHQFWN